MTMSISLSTTQKTRLPRFGYRIPLVGTISFLIVIAWMLVAVFAPYIAPHPVGDIVDFDFFGPMTAAVMPSVTPQKQARQTAASEMPTV